MAQVVIDRNDLGLELVVADVIVALPFGIDIHVVAAEGVCKHRANVAARMDGQLASCHQSLTQSQRDIGIDRYGRLQRNVKPQLYGSILLRVVANAGMQLHRLAFTGCKHHANTIGLIPFFLHLIPNPRNHRTLGNPFRQFLGYKVTFGSLVEQVHTHRSGELLRHVGIDAIMLGRDR